MLSFLLKYVCVEATHKTACGLEMHFHPTTLKDAWLIDLQPARDERGFFARTFCLHEFSAHGLETSFLQHSISVSPRRGTLRGMHFQREPHAEVQLVRCMKGEIWDVIIDMRPPPTVIGAHAASGNTAWCSALQNWPTVP